MDKHSIAKMIGANARNSEQEILNRLEKNMEAAESAGIYKAEADFWKERYQALRKECLHLIKRRKGLGRLSDILEEDGDVLSN